MNELDAQDAAELSRAEALRVLATAEDVPEKDRHTAELMLAGPEISFTEEQALRRFPSKRPVLDVAVKRALLEYVAAVAREREAAQAEVDELMGR